MEFKVEVGPASWKPDITVIKLFGSVDAQTAPLFEKEAMAAVGKGKKKVLVDCAGLDFISSAGIGVFMVILSEVEAEGFLRVMNLSDEVYESFEILGINEVMEIYKDEKDARRAIA
ncbi:MAG: hypothetical protein A3G34_11485 [Candidatus Lindowbacteria bacterium RIFCSPLOWO2_12_FULL_62_27]|nr:MAG: hypothetical protein A3I06_14450 [Candidatus Lindowbacteria bacterium RIFCSPLOWO2_02_FULL_62_12]OGH60878.1 MAG: hypothetical protein A3G34_11485 [Candidatus Lindowbacteria bacterium RIFCSPLOWO2_12_FULL_62_27]